SGVCDFVYDGSRWNLIGNYLDPSSTASKLGDSESGFTPENVITVWAKDSSGKQGWVSLDDNAGNNGQIISGADLAEIYQSTEKLVPGDVVSIDTTKDNAIVKTKVA
ncbi:MAG: hypothetical protein IKN42_01310, partial [Elusimicrobia bacterium]|nr:hypothetical protein [Elusimicrobiota bacterium]